MDETEESDSYSDDSEECLNMLVNTVKSNKSNNLIYAKVKFIVNEESKKVKCFCDTGSTCNVIGRQQLEEIYGNEQKLSKTTVILRAFGGNLIQPMGSVIVKCQTEGITKKVRFQVVKKSQIPLLSASTCQGLNLIQVKSTNAIESMSTSEKILNEFAEIFEGDGKLEGAVHLEIDANIKPVQEHPRRIPITVRNELAELLEDLEKRGIVKKVNKHTDWTSNCLIVRRNGKIRLCMDPFELNKALKRSNFQIPTIEEILPDLTDYVRCKKWLLATVTG